MSTPIDIDEIQGYAQGLIEAHPALLAAGIKTVADDGQYPKIPQLEKTMRERGLGIVVWRTGFGGLVDTGKTGLSSMELVVVVIVLEDVLVNRTAAPFPEGLTPTGITALKTVRYVMEALLGQPRNVPPGTPFKLEDWKNWGVQNGLSCLSVMFTKQFRINPANV